MIKRIGFTAIAAFALSVAAQATDMESGTWVMNVAKSTASNRILPPRYPLALITLPRQPPIALLAFAVNSR